MSINLIEAALEKAEERRRITREHEIKRIIEALLFSSNSPLSLDKMREIIGADFSLRNRELKEFIHKLAEEYRKEQRAFEIVEIAEGYLLRTEGSMRPYIEQLYRERRGEKLSPAATEVLAIVAYRGPITRREIEKLRGVDSSGTVISLIERGLIQEAGRKESPGRPMLYKITARFLHHFGLKDSSELKFF